MATTATVPIVIAHNKDLTASWHLAFQDEKVIWLSPAKPKNWKEVEKRALKFFLQEDPARNPGKMTKYG